MIFSLQVYRAKQSPCQGRYHLESRITVQSSSLDPGREFLSFRFQGPLCASEATVDDVETRVVSVGRASAETLKTEYIFGATALNAVIMDTATITSANNVTLSLKTFTGTVRVKNASLDAIEGVDFRSEPFRNSRKFVQFLVHLDRITNDFFHFHFCQSS